MATVLCGGVPHSLAAAQQYESVWGVPCEGLVATSNGLISIPTPVGTPPSITLETLETGGFQAGFGGEAAIFAIPAAVAATAGKATLAAASKVLISSGLAKLAAYGISAVVANKIIKKIEVVSGVNLPFGLTAEEILAMRSQKPRAKQGLFNKRALKTLKKACRYKDQYKKHAGAVGLKVVSSGTRKCPTKKKVC